MVQQERLVLALAGLALGERRPPPEADRLTVAPDEVIAVRTQADESMLAGELSLRLRKSSRAWAENESRFGANAHESSSFRAEAGNGSFSRLVLEVRLEMPTAQHEAVDGCESLRIRLLAPQAESDDVLSLGKLEGPQVVPGHETGVVGPVGGDVSRLLNPGCISFHPLLCLVFLGDCVGVEFDPRRNR